MFCRVNLFINFQCGCEQWTKVIGSNDLQKFNGLNIYITATAVSMQLLIGQKLSMLWNCLMMVFRFYLFGLIGVGAPSIGCYTGYVDCLVPIFFSGF